MGVPVPDAVLRKRINFLKANGKISVDKDRIEKLAVEFMEYKKSRKDLIESFKRIANDGGVSGKITPSRLINLLSNVGEKFSKEMMESMIKDTAEQTDSSGHIDYQALARKMVA